MRWLVVGLALAWVCGVAGQVIVRPEFSGEKTAGPVSILITSPQTGPGLGPKFDLNQEFDLAFELQLANLTLANLTLQVLVFDDKNQSYVPLNPDWILGGVNASFEFLSGPSRNDGVFKIRIPERGYYFLKLRASYVLEGRHEYAEAGNIAFGPRIRVIPVLDKRSYLVIVGMPILPLIAGISVRYARRRETRKRRRPEPDWLQRLRQNKTEREGSS